VVGGLVTRPMKIVILPMVYEWVERRAAYRAERRAALSDQPLVGEAPTDESEEADV
jgi:hypothetical protein